MIYEQRTRLSFDGCIPFHSNDVPSLTSSDAILVLLGSLWLRTRHTHRAYNPLPWERACDGIEMKIPLESLCTLLDILDASLSVFLVHCWGSKKLPQENRPASAERLHHRVCTQNHWQTNTLCSNKPLTTPKHACKHSPKNHWRSWKFPGVVRIHGIPVCHLLTREIHWFPDVKVTMFGADKGSRNLYNRTIFLGPQNSPF